MYQNIILLFVNVSWDELVGIFIVGVEWELNGRPGEARGELARGGLSSSCNVESGSGGGDDSNGSTSSRSSLLLASSSLSFPLRTMTPIFTWL